MVLTAMHLACSAEKGRRKSLRRRKRVTFRQRSRWDWRCRRWRRSWEKARWRRRVLGGTDLALGIFMRGPRGTLIPSLAGHKGSLLDILRHQIKAQGPLSMAEYMQQCLCHPDFGYYMRRDVFGRRGDFTTSPEISQLFGEMVGVWTSIALDRVAKPKWQLLEFGPGRGTLSLDVLRAVRDVRNLTSGSLHLIEISPELRKVQQRAVQETFTAWGMPFQRDLLSPTVERLWRNDFSVTWYPAFQEFVARQLTEKVTTPTLMLAHEFFDALPVHQFQYFRARGWCERLVTVNSSDELEITVSPQPTSNTLSILKPEKRFDLRATADLQEGDMIEVPEASLKQMMDVCEFMKHRPSTLLVADYGEDHSFSNSLRAIKEHQKLETGWLNIPGEADLSAYVDFAGLKAVVKQYPELGAMGPVPQGAFLESMGISLRLDMLLQKATVEQGNRLESEVERLVSPLEMGEIYKFLYIGTASLGELYPFIPSLHFSRKK